MRNLRRQARKQIALAFGGITGFDGVMVIRHYSLHVMPGLGPGIHAFLNFGVKEVRRGWPGIGERSDAVLPNGFARP